LPDLLGRMINETPMNIYRDEVYGYRIRYPSFFEQIPDTMLYMPQTQDTMQTLSFYRGHFT